MLRGRRREPARPGCGVTPAGEGAEEAESLPGLFLEGRGSRLGRRRAPATPASDEAAGREAAPGPRVSLRPPAGTPGWAGSAPLRRTAVPCREGHGDGKFLENSTRRRWRHVELKARVAARRRQSNSAPVKGEKNSRRGKSEPALQSEEEIYRSKRREIEEEINDSAVSRGSNKTAL